MKQNIVKKIALFKLLDIDDGDEETYVKKCFSNNLLGINLNKFKSNEEAVTEHFAHRGMTKKDYIELFKKQPTIAYSSPDVLIEKLDLWSYIEENKICKHCNAIINANTQFCPQCGKTVISNIENNSGEGPDSVREEVSYFDERFAAYDYDAHHNLLTETYYQRFFDVLT